MRDETLARLATDTIALLERDGMIVFDRFANAGDRPLRHTGERYRGGNVFALWATAQIKGYTSPYWMTFKQATEFKACVRKGERSTVVMYWDKVKVRGKAADAGDGTVVTDEDGTKSIMFAKAYPVFNACQIDGLPARFFPTVQRNPGFDPIQGVEAFVTATGAKVREGLNAAYYSPSEDHIAMPARTAFTDAAAFYATLLHELIHWTGPKSRLGRDQSGRFGGENYAMEELVAEIGSALLCGDLGLAKEPREDHAHYLASWLRALKRDPKALWTAASAAEKAADFLHAMQPAAAEPERLAA